MATRGQVMGMAGLAALTGTAILGYILWAVPPFLSDGSANTAALILFLFGMLLFVFGVGSLVSLALHRRWPALAGVRDRRRKPMPWVALRQGALLSLAVGVMLLLTLLRMFDLAFAMVTLVLAGLLEGFFQNRQR